MREEHKRQSLKGMWKAIGPFVRKGVPNDKGITRFAAVIGVKRPTVKAWLDRRYPTADYCPQIVERVNQALAAKGSKERLTLHELRPDLWLPEVTEEEATKETAGA